MIAKATIPDFLRELKRLKPHSPVLRYFEGDTLYAAVEGQRDARRWGEEATAQAILSGR